MGWLIRGLLLYLCIAIAVAFASPQVIFSSGSVSDNSFLSFFDLHYTSDYSFGNATLQGDASDNSLSFTSQSSIPSGSSFLLLIDPIYQIFSWIGTFFKLLFSPLVLLTSSAFTGAPVTLIYIFLPLVFMVIVGLIVFIRGGQA